jgi:hypothetical protein
MTAAGTAVHAGCSMRHGAPVLLYRHHAGRPGVLCFACRQLSRLDRSRYRRRTVPEPPCRAEAAAHWRRQPRRLIDQQPGTAVTSAATITRPRVGRTGTTRVPGRSPMPSYVDESDAVWFSDWAPQRKLWGAQSGADKPFVQKAEQGRGGQGSAWAPHPGFASGGRTGRRTAPVCDPGNPPQPPSLVTVPTFAIANFKTSQMFIATWRACPYAARL